MSAINSKKILLTVTILTLISSTVLFAYLWNVEKQANAKLLSAGVISGRSANYLNFLNLFIDRVLKAKGEIDFETRLQLETAVRNLDDKEVLAAWQSFADSKTENEAQENVKNLLDILVDKTLAQ